MGRTIALSTERLHKEIEAILFASGKSLHFKEIAMEIGRRGNFKDFGLYPAGKVYSAITNDIRLHPEVTRFEKTGLGTFGLKHRPTPKPAAFLRSAGVTAVKPKARSIPKREDMWTELAAKHAKSPNKGHEIQAFADVADLFLGLDAAGHRMLYLKCELEDRDRGAIGDGEYYRAWKETQPNPLDGRRRVILQQLDDDPDDAFTTLVRKALRELLHKQEIGPFVFEEAIETAIDRLHGKKEKPLNAQQQMGLIAELWFLRNILMEHLPPEEAIDAWHGQNGSERDFWLPGVHIEVKASGKISRWVTISSIDQLETDKLSPPLYLFNLCLAKSLARDSRQGKTLTEYVDEIREDLRTRKDVRDKAKCQREFKERLLGAIPTDLGCKRFREDHRGKYKTKYQVFSDEERGDTQRGTFYLVDRDFPRLRLKKGVRIQTYDIDLDDCDEYQRDEKAVVPLIKIRGKDVR